LSVYERAIFTASNASALGRVAFGRPGARVAEEVTEREAVDALLAGVLAKV